MAAAVSASRVVAGASSSVALSRGRAQLKAVKMGEAQARGSMVVVAVRKSRVSHPARGEKSRAVRSTISRDVVSNR